MWIGLWAARWARLAMTDESTPPERKTARGTSLARWSLRPSSRMAARLLLVHRRIGRAVGDAPEVLLADLLAGAVELESAGPARAVDAL